MTAVFQDAWALYEDAIEDLSHGKLRNAAEKAWGATKRAADALILAWTGEGPELSARTTRGLHSLVSQDANIETLIGRYHTRASYLHGQCFYNGMCEPSGEVERRIRKTDNYISGAQGLASAG